MASLGDGNQAGNGQPAQDNRSDEDKMRDFAKCMRDHGIDVKEPETAPGPGGGGGGISIGIEAGQEDELRAAQEACQHLMPNGGKPKPLDAAELDKLREHAKCLRDNGLDVPDPDPDDPGIKIDSGDDPEKVDKAFEACQHIMGGDGPMLEKKDEPK